MEILLHIMLIWGRKMC